jgi:alpha-galactosidase
MEIAIVGAGSHFTLNLLRSMYQEAEHDDYHLRLMDVRTEPLNALSELVRRLNVLTGRSFQFSCHCDRISALNGADHVLAAFAVDFPASFLRTCWVMRNHGIQFVEGETATPGALMSTLRHLPLLISITEEIREHTGGAWLHIVNNPMPRLALGIIRGTGYTRVVGHCHGTMEVCRHIANLTDTPAEDIDLFVAGINHFHLVQRAVDRRDGRDLLKTLDDLPDEKIEQWKKENFTQWRMYRELGYLVGHGIWHNFDYLPYANHRMFSHRNYNTWERYCLAMQSKREAGAEGEIGSQLTTNGALKRFMHEPEEEQMFAVMRALSCETPPYPFLSGNMPNAGHIPSLPDGVIVELPATVTPEGIELSRAEEPLPLLLELWLRQQVAIHDLSVRATLENSRQAAIEAIACDPSFRDCDCGPDQLLDELLDANRGLVPSLQ